MEQADYKVDPQAVDIARKLGKLVQSANIDVQQVLLFGSRARGNWAKWSDVDICVVSPDFGRDVSEEMGLLLRLTASLKSSLPVEPIPLTPDGLNDKYSTLASEVRKYGVPVEID